MTGTIKTVKEQGYGFIQLQDGSGDVFFHTSGLRGMSIADLSIADAQIGDVDADESGRPSGQGHARRQRADVA